MLLRDKFTIPAVKEQKETLERVQQDVFWQLGNVDDWETARKNLRDLLYCLKNEHKMKIIDISDEVLFEREGHPNTPDRTFESY